MLLCGLILLRHEPHEALHTEEQIKWKVSAYIMLHSLALLLLTKPPTCRLGTSTRWPLFLRGSGAFFAFLALVYRLCLGRLGFCLWLGRGGLAGGVGFRRLFLFFCLLFQQLGAGPARVEISWEMRVEYSHHQVTTPPNAEVHTKDYPNPPSASSKNCFVYHIQNEKHNILSPTTLIKLKHANSTYSTIVSLVTPAKPKCIISRHVKPVTASLDQYAIIRGSATTVNCGTYAPLPGRKQNELGGFVATPDFPMVQLLSILVFQAECCWIRHLHHWYRAVITTGSAHRVIGQTCVVFCFYYTSSIGLCRFVFVTCEKEGRT